MSGILRAAAVFFAVLLALSVPSVSGTDPVSRFTLYPTQTGEGYAAELTLFSCDGADESRNLIQSYGHAFLALRNTGTDTIQFCGRTLAPGDVITFGWWATDGHNGLWFNIEANYIALWGRYARRVALSVTPDAGELVRVAEYALSHDIYTPFENCALRASQCFDLVAGDGLRLDAGLLVSPGELCRLISERGGGASDIVFRPCEITYSAGEQTGRVLSFSMTAPAAAIDAGAEDGRE